MAKKQANESGKMTLKEAEDILFRIYHEEGQPILIVSHAGGYKGGVSYSMIIGVGRIRTEQYSSIEELLKATQELVTKPRMSWKERRKKAEEFVDSIKETWQAKGSSCKGWDEEKTRESLIGAFMWAIEECNKTPG